MEVLVAAVSDGAGTAKRSDIGSALAVESFLERFRGSRGRGA
ncbi:protein phosphatase 2C domain-containing protein [Dankookia sp. P2]